MENRWNDPLFPKDGWSFFTINDEGPVKEQDPAVMCEMCGTMQIRYVHVLHHNEEDALNAGCECASKLLGEDSSKTKSRENFSKRKWKVAVSTTEAYTTALKIRSATYKLKVWRYRGEWYLSVNRATVVNVRCPTLNDVKHSAFDHVYNLAHPNVV